MNMFCEILVIIKITFLPNKKNYIKISYVKSSCTNFQIRFQVYVISDEIYYNFIKL